MYSVFSYTFTMNINQVQMNTAIHGMGYETNTSAFPGTFSNGLPKKQLSHEKLASDFVKNMVESEHPTIQNVSTKMWDQELMFLHSKIVYWQKIPGHNDSF